MIANNKLYFNTFIKSNFFQTGLNFMISSQHYQRRRHLKEVCDPHKRNVMSGPVILPSTM